MCNHIIVRLTNILKSKIATEIASLLFDWDDPWDDFYMEKFVLDITVPGHFSLKYLSKIIKTGTSVLKNLWDEWLKD